MQQRQPPSRAAGPAPTTVEVGGMALPAPGRPAAAARSAVADSAGATDRPDSGRRGFLAQGALSADGLIGLLSHELRTPVTTIYGGSKLLARRAMSLSEEDRQALVVDLESEADRLYRLIEDLLALARLDEVAEGRSREPVLLQRIAADEIEAERRARPDADLRLAVPRGLSPVWADPALVRHVLRNLLANAASRSGAPAEVRIAGDLADDEVQLRVFDRSGLPPAEDIFEDLASDAARLPYLAGSGLDLYVCDRLVRAMGGRIWARARPEGGSEFGFALPVIQPDET
ncbi:MAG TPA: ATP-binding protein [Candidatus Limnocylindrales bacterium]|nr:ATP-binding protein [Candidatus Limnocylindrales bacterium]